MGGGAVRVYLHLGKAIEEIRGCQNVLRTHPVVT